MNKPILAAFATQKGGVTPLQIVYHGKVEASDEICQIIKEQ